VNETLRQLAAALAASDWLERLAVLTGLIYVILIARRQRLGWLVGGFSSVIYVYISWQAHLPLQAALQVFYVATAVYGWYKWSAAGTSGQPRVCRWGLTRHLLSLGAIFALGLLAARTLAAETHSAWPLLDSLTTVTCLLASWLVVHAILENWLYWIAADAVSAFMFYVQGNALTAALFTIYLIVAAIGYITWLRIYRKQQP
jgi:nicotinamide mononucleotide transporter